MGYNFLLTRSSLVLLHNLGTSNLHLLQFCVRFGFNGDGMLCSSYGNMQFSGSGFIFFGFSLFGFVLFSSTKVWIENILGWRTSVLGCKILVKIFSIQTRLVLKEMNDSDLRGHIYRSRRAGTNNDGNLHQESISYAAFCSRRNSNAANFCVGGPSNLSQSAFTCYDVEEISASVNPNQNEASMLIRSVPDMMSMVNRGGPVIRDVSTSRQTDWGWRSTDNNGQSGVIVTSTNRRSKRASSSLQTAHCTPRRTTRRASNLNEAITSTQTDCSLRNTDNTGQSGMVMRVTNRRSKRASYSQQLNHCSRRRTTRRGLPIACDYREIPDCAMQLKPPTFCKHCGAKKYQYETPGFCCSNGEVKLPKIKLPKDLTDLFKGRDADSSNFRIYGRLYNNLMAFSSLGGQFPCERSRGIFTFKVHGQIYHHLPSLVPTDKIPRFMQLYFYDAQHQHENRTKLFKELRSTVISRLMKIMESNPYAQFFQSLKNTKIDEHIAIRINKNPAFDQRVYNPPSSSEVAGILLDSTTSSDTGGPYIVVTGKNLVPHRIMHYYGCYDPLQYPLLFPRGESGWRPGLPRCNPKGGETTIDFANPVMMADTAENLLLDEETLASSENTKKSRQISCREFYCYLFQIREDNELLHAERIWQQLVVDMYVKLENTRLDFFRNNQDSIRADLYQGIMDTAHTGEDSAANVGHIVILPPSFIGGPRDMKRRYLNAMALVQRFGKPDLFVTITCNPNWPEIQSELKDGQHAQNRPDLLARVFRARLVHLKKLIVEQQIFGKVAAYIYVVEFQKRGLPHAHFLIILSPQFKLRSPEDYDRYVSAELPPESQPHLRSAVKNHMVHGPCGDLKPNCGCMREIKGQKSCRFKYPKEFKSYTTTNKNGYPLYKRTNTGEVIHIRGADLDNRWVIPYNPYLLALFDCHINVEVCSTVEAVKYLYKYVYKGHDKVAFNLGRNANQQSYDEIDLFQTGRWISPPEAIWRIFGFSLYEMYPPVLPLQVHLPDMQTITFTSNERLSSIISDDYRSRTPLTEFFRMNQSRSSEQKYLYAEYPEYFTWEKRSKRWKKREQRVMIGRLTFVNPSDSERFYLRLLLTDVRGPTSFRDLLTINRHVHTTFHEAAIARGLVQQDNAAERCLNEVVALQMPAALQRLFVTLLIFCNPPNPKKLWDQYYRYFSEDIRLQYPSSEAKILSETVRRVEHILDSLGRTLDDFELGYLHQDQVEEERVIRDIRDILEAPIPQEYIAARKQLNSRQKDAYKKIVRCIKDDVPGCFFIDGPGGTGKTFLYCALYAKVRTLGKIVLPTASSGIAASNLPCGRTAHSRFKLPIDPETDLVCNVPKQGALAALLRRSSLIIWDEAPMANKASIHSLDLLLRDLTDCDLPFGGKVIVLGGDFRQVLPVVPRKTQQEAVEASLVSSHLWSSFTRFYLTENIRAQSDPEFARFLLALGDGRLQHDEVSSVALPSHMIIPFSRDENPIHTLITHVFPEFLLTNFDSKIFIDRAVLAPRNDEVELINESLIKKFPGELVTYKSIDKLLDDNCNIYPVEFLHTLAPSGMAPYELKLKVNCPVILLRNLDPSTGLCNGTRLICKQFLHDVIVCEIASGFEKGQLTLIHRVHLRPPAGSHFPFQFQRTQFPVRLCFAMTVNKAQGQTLDKAIIYLRQPCFSHGQLYVALSRVRHSSGVKVMLEDEGEGSLSHTVRNVISFEALRRAGINLR